MWWASLLQVAWAVDPVWSYDELVTGVANDEYAVAVAQRVWGPTDEIFLVFQLYDEPAAAQYLWLKGYDCDGSTDCDTLTNTWGPDVLGSTVYGERALTPALAVRGASGGARAVHVIRRAKVNTDCDDDGIHYTAELSSDEDYFNMDLSEQVWLTSANNGAGGVAASRVVWQNPTNVCEDNVVPFAKWRDDTAFASWTHKTDVGTANEVNTIWTDERDTASGGQWDAGGSRIEFTNANDDIQDHSWMDFDGTGTSRAIAYHVNDGTHKIKLAFPDRAGSPVASLGSNGSGANYPFVDVVGSSGNEFYLGYQEALGGGVNQLTLGSCDESIGDCSDGGDWTQENPAPHSGANLSHVEFRADGDKQFLLFTQNIVPSGGAVSRARAHVMWRCAGNTWEGPAKVNVGSSTTQHHDLTHGRTHLALDAQDDILFVALIETTDTNLQVDGNVISARAPYTACGGASDTDF